ncbi:hypothetical protein DPMN_067789 [Dreissena polymorpha]|uniref:Mab-21-like HhH/H2TH-like domain-containing protein n=1 Tax=Dreissena polymorpha TaxID=45954 RepID=A0A9D3YZV1_DREPO|nr:hypothetical protein DPMN_067789 [Dreissena polymorpha]
MTWLGYGPEILQARRDAYKEHASLTTKIINSSGMITFIITGSKAEGLTFYLESDRDNMVILNCFICLEDGVNANTILRQVTVLRSCSRMSYPGHCRLLLERRGSINFSIFNDALCDDGYGRALLSSDLHINGLSNFPLGKNTVRRDRVGPSTPNTVYGRLHHDLVHAFRYNCPNILSKWAARPRSWPPPEVVQQVVSLGGFLTPVGFKGSKYPHVEWRVCFNAGEIELVNNLNETQIKLYVLLKMVKDDVLHPRKKEVSSYTLKNIVLWIAENNPQSLFDERSMLHWFQEGLNALRVALFTRELPYYMIPEINLLAACGLEEEQQRTWISTITEMINEGPRVILRLPKIRQVLIAHPEPFRWYSRRRMELEIMELIINNYLRIDENGALDLSDSDENVQALIRRQMKIMMEVFYRMISEGSRVNCLNDVFDRMLM